MTDAQSSGRVLVVDDDPGVRDLVRDFLAQHNFNVDAVADGKAMQRALGAASYDVIVLDVMLPGEDGLSICRRLLAEKGPKVIMLSAMGEDTDRIVGLELGADDYLAKPCNPRELLARVRAVLRRSRATGADEAEQGTQVVFAGWTLDLIRRELVSAAGVSVHLSGGEFSLLRAFVERPRRVLSREQLLDLARGSDTEVFDRSIDVQISRLRRKLGDSGDGLGLIRTIRNEGYMLDARVARR